MGDVYRLFMKKKLRQNCEGLKHRTILTESFYTITRMIRVPLELSMPVAASLILKDACAVSLARSNMQLLGTRSFLNDMLQLNHRVHPQTQVYPPSTAMACPVT